ncbi:PAS domain-containing protein [Dactylosporangium cerinum]
MSQTRVLIVEDDPDDARLIVTRLHRGGLDLTVDIVTTAEQFRAALREHPPDLVISDYNLPSFTAEEALRTLREHSGDAPFILVSGQVGEETAAAMMKAGASDFVLKDRSSRLVPAVQRELRDADERRQRRAAEAALRESEQRFRLLAEHSIDIIFRFRLQPDRRLEYISPAITAITGHEPAEVYADPSLLVATVDEEDREAFRTSWLLPRPRPLVVRAHHPDGRQLWIEQRAILITDGAGTPIAVEGTLRDVTEQQRLDHELRQAERLDSSATSPAASPTTSTTSSRSSPRTPATSPTPSDRRIRASPTSCGSATPRNAPPRSPGSCSSSAASCRPSRRSWTSTRSSPTPNSCCSAPSARTSRSPPTSTRTCRRSPSTAASSNRSSSTWSSTPAPR